ncbi:uncharacterized protein VNE69_08098 [Vairimorpha necatrix]|uniref:Uncharacterized protein n=1 Tax=Vairimorpha necatrix TaxID=6039 RepID=A0AAX4JEY6_9MICR
MINLLFCLLKIYCNESIFVIENNNHHLEVYLSPLEEKTDQTYILKEYDNAVSYVFSNIIFKDKEYVNHLLNYNRSSDQEQNYLLTLFRNGNIILKTTFKFDNTKSYCIEKRYQDKIIMSSIIDFDKVDNKKTNTDGVSFAENKIESASDTFENFNLGIKKAIGNITSESVYIDSPDANEKSRFKVDTRKYFCIAMEEAKNQPINGKQDIEGEKTIGLLTTEKTEEQQVNNFILNISDHKHHETKEKRSGIINWQR